MRRLGPLWARWAAARAPPREAAATGAVVRAWAEPWGAVRGMASMGGGGPRPNGQLPPYSATAPAREIADPFVNKGFADEMDDDAVVEMVMRDAEEFRKDKRARRRNRQARRFDFPLAPINVAIVGRPNVGKSTLFNRMVRDRKAIVSKVAGTTRDRKEGQGNIGELEYTLVDTGGFEDLVRGSKSPTEMLAPEHGVDLVRAMHEQARLAVVKADVVMLVVDAKDGISGEDQELARWVRRNARTDPGTRQRVEQAVQRVPALRDAQAWVEPGLILIANKTEGRGDAFEWGNSDDHWATFLQDCYRLGFGDPIPISAGHGDGMGDVHNALLPYAVIKGEDAEEVGLGDVSAPAGPAAASPKEVADQQAEAEGRINMALIGRPNVGKSTLLNKLAGEERSIAGPVPGLTRDSIDIDLEFEGRKLRLVDTAGVRRRAKLKGGMSSAMASAERLGGRDAKSTPVAVRKDDAMLEDLAIQNSLRALDRAHVVAVVVDATAQQDDLDASGPLSKHDLAIMGRVLDEGRALVVVANKCDLTVDGWEDKISGKIEDYIRAHVELVLPAARGVPVLPMSALHEAQIQGLLPTVIKTFDRWRSRVPTHKLNKWLAMAQMRHRPPASAGASYRGKKTQSGPLKIKYATQVSSRPPTFALFVNRFNPGQGVIPADYQRYLTNSLRKTFDLNGVPLRFSVRSSTSSERTKNPKSRAGSRNTSWRQR